MPNHIWLHQSLKLLICINNCVWYIAKIINNIRHMKYPSGLVNIIQCCHTYGWLSIYNRLINIVFNVIILISSWRHHSKQYIDLSIAVSWCPLSIAILKLQIISTRYRWGYYYNNAATINTNNNNINYKQQQKTNHMRISRYSWKFEVS